MTGETPGEGSSSRARNDEPSIFSNPNEVNRPETPSPLDGQAGALQRSSGRSVDPRASAESSISDTYRRYLRHLDGPAPRSPSPASSPAPPASVPAVSAPAESQFISAFSQPHGWQSRPSTADHPAETSRRASSSSSSGSAIDPRISDISYYTYQISQLTGFDLDDSTDEESVRSMQDSDDGFQEPEMILHEIPNEPDPRSDGPSGPAFLIKWKGVPYHRCTYEIADDWSFLKDPLSPVMLEWRERQQLGEPVFDMERFERYKANFEESDKLRRILRRYKRKLLKVRALAEAQAADNGATLPIPPGRKLTAREWELPREERERLICERSGLSARAGVDRKGKGKEIESLPSST